MNVIAGHDKEFQTLVVGRYVEIAVHLQIVVDLVPVQAVHVTLSFFVLLE